MSVIKCRILLSFFTQLQLTFTEQSLECIILLILSFFVTGMSISEFIKLKTRYISLIFPSIHGIHNLKLKTGIIFIIGVLYRYIGCGEGRERGKTSYNICRIDHQNSKAILGMRLMFTLLLAVSLSAVFSRAAVIKANAQSNADGGDPPDQQNHVQRREKCNLTFDEFKSKYKKKYSSVAEQNYRKNIFHSNLRKLNQHNSNPTRTFNMKPNSFLDVSPREFKSLYTNTYQSNVYSRDLSQAIIHPHRKRTCSQNLTSDNPCNSTQDIASQISLNSTNNETTVAEECGEATRGGFSKVGRKLQTLPLTKNDNFIITAKDIKSLEALTSYSTKPLTNCSKINPTNIDWTLYSGAIRYQGFCGACYAFSTVDTLAAHHAIGTFGSFVALSVQQIVDCVDNGLTFGCHGGFLEGSYTYIQIKGVASQFAYPYTAVENGQREKCKFHGGPFKLQSFHPIKQGDCKGVIKQLANGPISAGISGYNLQFYEQGIFNECDQYLDHAIIIIGYKSGKGWKIKNSWGREWGINGYGWIAEGNTCGICDMAVTIRI